MRASDASRTRAPGATRGRSGPQGAAQGSVRTPCELVVMTEGVDLVYERLVADEKLKSGTKYERLAAIVFRLLTEQLTVHDLRLKGDTGVPHQIDAVIGPEHKRVLIEAKDYERTVDLPIAVHFWGVVEDLKPDEAFIVTTRGFSGNATKYAKAKGIRLAVLRPRRTRIGKA